MVFFSLWLPLVGWCGLIYYLSSLPSLKTASDPFWDEIIRSGAHLFFFGVLYYLSFRAFGYRGQSTSFLTPLLFSWFYGFTDEAHQIFVETRTFQWQDLILDFSGSLLGLVVIKLLSVRLPKRLRRLAKKWTIL